MDNVSLTALKAPLPSRKDAHQLSLTVTSPALLRDGSDREFRRFVHDLLAFTARLHSTRNGLAELIGLTGTQYTILISIAHLEKEGEISISAIAKHLHLSGAFVTIATNRLIHKGLVRKEPGSTDRRRVRLSVTDAGRELLQRLAPHQAEVNDTLFASMTARDLERMLEILPDLIADAEAASGRLVLAAAAMAKKPGK